MPIDPRIPLMGDAPPQFNVMGTMRNIAQMKRMEAISQQEQQEMALRQQAAQEDAQFKQVLVETGGDPEKALPRLMQINPKRALEFQKLHLDNQKTTAETSAFTRTQKEDEQFRTVLTESGGELNDATMSRLKAINLKRALEFQKLTREAEGSGDFSTETVESGEIMAFNKRTGKFEPTGQRGQPKAVAGSLEAQAVAKLEKELGRPLTSAELEQLHGRWGKADDRPISINTGSEPLVAIVGPDGKPVLVSRRDALGKTPASTRDSGGGRGVTSGDAGRIAEINTALDELKSVKSALGTVKGSTGTKAAIGAWLPNVVTETTGIGAKAKSKQAIIDRSKQIIGKGLEGGVLRAEDEKKYTKILVTISDPDDVVETKLKGMEQALIDKRTRMLESLDDAGYNTDNYRARGTSAPAAPPPADGVKVGRFTVREKK